MDTQPRRQPPVGGNGVHAHHGESEARKPSAQLVEQGVLISAEKVIDAVQMDEERAWRPFERC